MLCRVLKGTVPWDFDFSFFSWISFCQAPEYTIRAVSIFLQKFAEMFGAQGTMPVSLTLVATGKNLSIRKVLIILFGHLWVVELTYTVDKFFTSSWFIMMQQSYNVPIICHRYQQHQRYRWQNLLPVACTSGKFATGVVDSSGAPWLENISASFRKFLKWPKCYFKGKMTHEKKPKAKNLVTLSL